MKRSPVLMTGLLSAAPFAGGCVKQESALDKAVDSAKDAAESAADKTLRVASDVAKDVKDGK